LIVLVLYAPIGEDSKRLAGCGAGESGNVLLLTMMAETLLLEYDR